MNLLLLTKNNITTNKSRKEINKKIIDIISNPNFNTIKQIIKNYNNNL